MYVSLNLFGISELIPLCDTNQEFLVSTPQNKAQCSAGSVQVPLGDCTRVTLQNGSSYKTPTFKLSTENIFQRFLARC